MEKASRMVRSDDVYSCGRLSDQKSQWGASGGLGKPRSIAVSFLEVAVSVTLASR